MQWRMMPQDLPPWYDVSQQARRWLSAGCFENIVHDLRLVLREANGRNRQPTAAILDSRTVPSTPASGQRAGSDAGKKRKGSTIHVAVDTVGDLLALVVTPANEQDRAHVEQVARHVQEATGEHVPVACVDHADIGDDAAEAAVVH